MLKPLRRGIRQYLANLHMHLPFDVAISPLGLYPEGNTDKNMQRHKQKAIY